MRASKTLVGCTEVRMVRLLSKLTYRRSRGELDFSRSLRGYRDQLNILIHQQAIGEQPRGIMPWTVIMMTSFKVNAQWGLDQNHW